jgi:hypothetical protein
VRTTAAGIEAQLRQLMAPLVALALLVQTSPDVPRLVARFGPTARELLAMTNVRPGGWGGVQGGCCWAGCWL